VEEVDVVIIYVIMIIMNYVMNMDVITIMEIIMKTINVLVM
jgi:hypothetical protein